MTTIQKAYKFTPHRYGSAGEQAAYWVKTFTFGTICLLAGGFAIALIKFVACSASFG